jgi:hypothetical protein
MHEDNAELDERMSMPANETYFSRYGDASTIARGDDSAEIGVAFRSLVTPLEQRLGKPLTGLGRQACIRAFRTHPDGFARLCQEALSRGRTNPIGLLIRMVAAEEHKLVGTSRDLEGFGD